MSVMLDDTMLDVGAYIKAQEMVTVGKDAGFEAKHPRGHGGKFAAQSGSIRQDAAVDAAPVSAESGTIRHDTPEFRSWFKDSKVVDAKGNPLVVYHGSRSDFSSFKTDATDNVSLFNTQVGSHFAVDPEVPNAFTAGQYAYAQDFHVNDYQPDESWYRGADGQIKYDGLPVLVKQDKDLHDIVVEPYDVNKHGSTWGMRDRLGPDYSVRMLVPGGAVYPVYLSIQHPLNVGTEDTGFDQNAITRAVEKVVFPEDKNLFVKAVTYGVGDKAEHWSEVWDALKSGKGYKSGEKYGNWKDWGEFAKDYGIGLLDRNTKEAKDILIKLGYDGIHYQNTSRNEVQPGHSGDTWIAFHPSQIKSVFNPTPHADSPDISKAESIAKRDATKLSASCVMAMIEPEDAKQFLDYGKTIPEDELYTEPSADDSFGPDYGLEKSPHFTALYGLETQDPAEIRAITDKFAPFTVVLGRVAMFENPDKPYDVVYAPGFSGKLRKLNARLKRLPYSNDYDSDYKIHCTLAYVKKGEGAKHVGDDAFAGRSVRISRLEFSTPEGVKTEIPLTKEQ